MKRSIDYNDIINDKVARHAFTNDIIVDNVARFTTLLEIDDIIKQNPLYGRYNKKVEEIQKIKQDLKSSESFFANIDIEAEKRLEELEKTQKTTWYSAVAEKTFDVTEKKHLEGLVKLEKNGHKQALFVLFRGQINNCEVDLEEIVNNDAFLKLLISARYAAERDKPPPNFEKFYYEVTQQIQKNGEPTKPYRKDWQIFLHMLLLFHVQIHQILNNKNS